MRALTIIPGRAGTLRLDSLDEPSSQQGAVLVRTLAVGVCGTDRELIEGQFGEAPPGQERLVLGHESLGRVVEAPPHSGLGIGDMVVGIVRHPDPLPCVNCALGEWDMCRNGQYTERGIKQAHGWEHVERIGRRARWAPRRVLVTGAGAVGLMGALLGLQRELEVHVYDRHDSGPKPDLVRELGARYHARFPALEFDIVIECTGAPSVIAQAVAGSAPGGIVCLTGIGGEHSIASFDVAALNQSLVLENRVVFGSVNANRRHYEAAAQALARAERSWLERIITRRLPLQEYEAAYASPVDDVKTVLVFEN
jgi:threonine dehydrogenase-like Zn-dependent dehydrogenase